MTADVPDNETKKLEARSGIIRFIRLIAIFGAVFLVSRDFGPRLRELGLNYAVIFLSFVISYFALWIVGFSFVISCFDYYKHRKRSALEPSDSLYLKLGGYSAKLAACAFVVCLVSTDLANGAAGAAEAAALASYSGWLAVFALVFGVFCYYVTPP